MTAKGHILLAVTPALYIAKSLDNVYLAGFIAGVFIGSILPDIDEPNSFIGKRLGFLSIPLRIMGLKHRTFTHYFIFGFIFFILSFLFDGIISIAILGVSFGVFMHDVGDMITKGGITGFLYPCCKNKTFRLLPKDYCFYTNSIIEHIIIFLLLSLLIIELGVYFGIFNL